jgi:hypothetical protein
MRTQREFRILDLGFRNSVRSAASHTSRFELAIKTQIRIPKS